MLLEFQNSPALCSQIMCTDTTASCLQEEMFCLSLPDCKGHIQCHVPGLFNGATHFSEPEQIYSALIKESLGWP